MTHPSFQAPVHLIYVPGLGDWYDTGRRVGLKLWQRPGVTVSFVPMRWRDKEESFELKQQRLDAVIDSKPNARVILVGESAGGAVAVSTAERYSDRIFGVITICGKNVGARNVSPAVYARHPAFRAAMLAADTAVGTMRPNAGRRYALLNARYDPVIGPADSEIPGAYKRILPTVGHQATIIFMLIAGRGIIRKTIRQLERALIY